MITRKRKSILYSTAAALLLSMGLTGNALALPTSEVDYDLKLLGKSVFFDNISSADGDNINGTMSCATCHVPSTGGTGGDATVNRSQVAITGANPHTVGSLKPPTNTYATMIPAFNSGDACGGLPGFCGGNFWNGRSVGGYFIDENGVEVTPEPQAGSTFFIGLDIFVDQAQEDRYKRYLGPTADQALNPFPNDVEQNVPLSANDNGLPGAKAVCMHVKNAAYGYLYQEAWGEPIDCYNNVLTSFQRIAVALSAYQASSEVNSFSSKRDVALANDEDKLFPLDGFTDQENYGHDLFYGSNESGLNSDAKNAGCISCHVSDKVAPNGTGLKERYTDDSYHSIGTPKNFELTNPECIVANPVDDNNKEECMPGLAGHVQSGSFYGFRKTPTLRNVDKRPNARFVKAYGANGWFKSLESIVHFYNTAFLGNCVVTADEDCTGARDVVYEDTTAAKFRITRCPEGVTTERMALRLNCWPEPEFSGERGSPAFPALLGNQGMTVADEAALVAYMKTLTDEVTAEPPVTAAPAVVVTTKRSRAPR